MKNAFLPLVATRSVIFGYKTTFYTTNEKIVVEAPHRFMQQLILLCDGTRTYEEVMQGLNEEWDDESVRELFETLRRKKVIIDVRHLSEEYWKSMENPSHFPSQITDQDGVRLAHKAARSHCSNPSETIYPVGDSSVGLLLTQRQSIRSFSETAVAFQSIVNMLWCAYGALKPQEDGRLRRTVPSAGALYPLIIHVVLFKQTGDLRPAIYSVYFGHSESVGFRFVSDDVLRFSRAFLGHLMFGKAHGVIVINGSFRVASEKYGNRGMPYILLEAGHVAQNINLAAVECDVATVEVGGFVDALLANAISLPKYYHPLITVVFGKKASEVRSEDLNPKMEVQWAVPVDKWYRPPFALISARMLEKKSWSQGRDASLILAYTKAVAEAKEWTACGCIPTLTRARFVDIETAVDPRSIIRFHPAQYRLKGFPFTPFDEKMDYAWTKGYDEEKGSTVYILADLVYFPYFPKTPYYAYANSSGVAAHPERQKAVETSVLELVERDSFMIAYLAQLKFPTVREQTLPESIRKRIRELRKIGFRVWIKDHTLDLAPVACVLAQSEKLTYTPCASCANFDIEHAVNHALMEVEALVLACLQNNGPVKRITPHEVMWPLDHGRLYRQRQYFHQADFLMNGRKLIAFQDIGKRVAQSWPELLGRFAIKGWRFFTIPLYLTNEYGGNGDLHIIRSIVPGMVPMTFGYRQEPAGMERIYMVARKFGNKKLSYRELTKFPHPFA